MNKDPASWLTGLVLGAASTLTQNTRSLVSMGVQHMPTGDYEVFGLQEAENDKPNPLASTSTYRLYVARLPTGQLGLMKTNATPDTMAALVNEARILEELQAHAVELDEDALDHGKQRYNYGAMFPKAVQVLSPTPQRFVMFLGYHPVITTYKQLVPLSRLLHNRRVDLATIQWMLGKLLKLLSFVHSFGYTIGLVDETNILIETDLHGVFALDFSNAKDNPTYAQYLAEVAYAVCTAWRAAGGTDTQDPPYDVEIMSKEGYDEYIAFLKRVKSGGNKGAIIEFNTLYAMADRIWPKETKTEGGRTTQKRRFHEYVDYPRQ